jgi:hypothetical protein
MFPIENEYVVMLPNNKIIRISSVTNDGYRRFSLLCKDDCVLFGIDKNEYLGQYLEGDDLYHTIEDRLATFRDFYEHAESVGCSENNGMHKFVRRMIENYEEVLYG